MRRALVFLSKLTQLREIAILLGIMLVSPFKPYAQTRYTLNNDASFNIVNYTVLPDAGYSFSKVLTDSSLVFKPDSLNPAAHQYYWAKIVIYNPYPNNEEYIFSFTAALNYTLYSYRPGTKKWMAESAGLNVLNGYRKPGLAACVLQKQAENTFYLKIDLHELSASAYFIKPTAVLEKKVSYDANELVLKMSFLICCVILLSFSIYNLYLYWGLKDDAYLYYVVVQVGTLVYFTADKFIFNLLLPFPFYSVKLLGPNHIGYFDINSFLDHMGVVIIMVGFIQFTRSYLGTRAILPWYDKLLKILCYAYILLDVVPAIITITKLHYFAYVAIVANIVILIIVVACVITGIAAVKQIGSVARYYLAAYLLPIIFTAGASVYILLYKLSSPVLPPLAIISQIFTFAVALVARIKLINDDLKKKEIEAVQLEANMTVTEYKRLLVEEENKNITLTMALEKERNDQLQQRLEVNERQLVGNSLYIHQKNKLLSDLKTQIAHMGNLNSNARYESLKNIESALKDGTSLDEDWDNFKLHFEQVHPSFFKDVLAKHPTLTKYELRLYAYFHINLSTKEIAALLNIVPTSVRQAKARLNKKMSISE